MIVSSKSGAPSKSGGPTGAASTTRRCAPGTQHLRRGPGRRPGGDAVVDHDHRASADVGRWTIATQHPRAPIELGTLVVEDALALAVGDPETPEEVLVPHHRATLADRAHRQLAVARSAELAHQHHVERGAERVGDAGGHRYATAGSPTTSAPRGTRVATSAPSRIPASTRSRARTAPAYHRRMALSDADERFLSDHHSAAMITVGTDGCPKVARMAVALIDGKLWSRCSARTACTDVRSAAAGGSGGRRPRAG